MKPTFNIPVVDRMDYYAHMKNRSEVDPITGCWVFQPVNPDPSDRSWETKYATIKYHGEVSSVMRAMYREIQGEDVPDGYDVRHRPIDHSRNQQKCHKRCCNPEHLVLFPVFSQPGKRYKNTKSIPAHMYPMKAVESKAALDKSNQKFRSAMVDFGVNPDKIRFPDEEK